jgi:hypothetical protein
MMMRSTLIKISKINMKIKMIDKLTAKKTTPQIKKLRNNYKEISISNYKTIINNTSQPKLIKS